MVNANFLKRLMVVGERNVLQQMTDYADLGEKAACELSAMFGGDDSIKSDKNRSIRNLEKSADVTSMKLKDQITGGAISSTMMDTILELVETCDDLLDGAYYISREVRRMHRNRHKFDDLTNKVIDESYSVFQKMITKFREALSHVRGILTAKGFDEMRGHREEIERIEEEADDLKDGMIDSIYDEADTLPYLVFTHVVGIAHRMDDLLDDCEDISDMVHTINVAITR